jgi:hypothetical protein
MPFLEKSVETERTGGGQRERSSSADGGVYRVSRACSRIAPAIRCRETQEASDRPWPSDLHTSHRPRPARLKAEGGTGTVPVLST